MKVNGSAERDSFSRVLASEAGADLGQVQAAVNKAIALISDAETNLGVNALDYFDFNDLLEADLAELDEAAQYIEILSRTKATENTVNTKFGNLEAQLAASNEAIQALVTERNALSAIVNKTAEQNA